MPSPNTSIIYRHIFGPPDDRRVVLYYERPLFMTYWFPILRSDGRSTWTMNIAQDWNGKDQCWTDTYCPYRILAAEYGILPKKPSVKTEDNIVDMFLTELPEDAQLNADAIRNRIDRTRCGRR